MHLALDIDRGQDNSRDLHTDGRVVCRAHRLIRILDLRDLDQAEGRAAEVDEEAERGDGSAPRPHHAPPAKAGRAAAHPSAARFW